MRVFFDTEFYSFPPELRPISIGLVREDGQEYYAEWMSFDWMDATVWLEENVRPHLTGPQKLNDQIARDIVDFCGSEPSFWAYIGAYDWVLLANIYGGLMSLPEHWPYIFNELKVAGVNDDFRNDRHHALADARWARDAFMKKFKAAA